LPLSVGREGLFIALLLLAGTLQAADCVVLLHGLARSDGSMRELAEELTQAGYQTVNVDYPSTNFPVEELADRYIPMAIESCAADSTVHFVTHSIGGILVRYWLANNDHSRVGRVVMLVPPNQGSELVDKLGGVRGFYLLNGPAGLQLGTDLASLPNTLGPIPVETGVIAGSKSFNPIYSAIIPGDDDGKVAVARTHLDGMTDFIVLRHTHTWITGAPPAQYQVRYFLEHGSFDHSVND